MVTPVLIIFFANLFLILRVIHQKRRHRTSWNRNRKLTIQLIGIAFIYILFWFPLSFNAFFSIFMPSLYSQQIQTNYFIFIVYLVPICLPFVFFISVPELKRKFFKRQQRRVIRPMHVNTL